MDIRKKLQSFDYLMLILVCSIGIFGIVVIGSATRIYLGASTDSYDKQKLWLISGLVLLFAASFIDYRFITKFYWVAYVVNIILCVAVLVLVDDTSASNVSRGLTLPGDISIQPSEFAKIFMLIFLATLIDRLGEKLNNIFILLFIIVSIAIPFWLIKEQPSLSASLVVLSVSIVVLFVGGVSCKYVLPAVIIVLPIGLAIYQDVLRTDHLFVHKIFTEYQLADRIIPFFDPERASAQVMYQTEQSIRAIGSGMLSGKGLYQGTLNSLSYVPYSYNDFIFAVIGEEFGYIGCIGVLAVMFVIILKCILTAYKADTITGRLIAAGVGFMFAFQTFVNVGVAVGLLPNTGMALPFISYGGSSMWVNMIAVGLVINVGMVKQKSLFEE